VVGWTNKKIEITYHFTLNYIWYFQFYELYSFTLLQIFCNENAIPCCIINKSNEDRS